MARSGYLTRARDARPPRRRPSAKCDPACGGCSQRGGERYASSAPAALRSRDRSNPARRRRESHVHDGTAGPAPARSLVLRRLRRCQRFAARADHGIDITVPREVRAPLQRDERRARNRGRDLTPEPKRHGAVVATMHDQLPASGRGEAARVRRGDRRDPTTRQRSRRSPPPAEICAKRSCSAGSAPPRNMSLSRREPSPQCARTAPRDRVPHARSRYLRAVGVRPVEHQALDALRIRCGEGDCGAAPARAADKRNALQLELVEQRAKRRDFLVDGQIRISQRSVRHSDAEPVIADECVAIRDAFPESPKARALPVEFEVAHPPRRRDERWTVRRASRTPRGGRRGEGTGSQTPASPRAYDGHPSCRPIWISLVSGNIFRWLRRTWKSAVRRHL